MNPSLSAIVLQFLNSLEPIMAKHGHKSPGYYDAERRDWLADMDAVVGGMSRTDAVLLTVLLGASSHILDDLNSEGGDSGNGRLRDYCYAANVALEDYVAKNWALTSQDLRAQTYLLASDGDDITSAALGDDCKAQLIRSIAHATIPKFSH